MSISPSAVISSAAQISHDAVIGDACTIGPFVAIPAFTTLGKRVHLESNVAFARAAAETAPGRLHIADDVVIGANSTLIGSLTIGSGARIMPGSVVARDVPENAIVSGNPAAIISYADIGEPAILDSRWQKKTNKYSTEAIDVGNVVVHHFPVITDIRGSLTVGEFERDIPFVPLRYFMVFDVPSRETRGEHAHKVCHQFLICVQGCCAVVVDDGQQRREIILDNPARGLHLPPMTWGTQYKYSANATLLVFASHHYDSNDYIRRYSDFIAAIKHEQN